MSLKYHELDWEECKKQWHLVTGTFGKNIVTDYNFISLYRELLVKYYEEHRFKQILFEDNGKFVGLCMLGTEVTNSTIEMQEEDPGYLEWWENFLSSTIPNAQAHPPLDVVATSHPSKVCSAAFSHMLERASASRVTRSWGSSFSAMLECHPPHRLSSES